MDYNELLLLKQDGETTLHKCGFWAVTFACGYRMICGQQVIYRAGTNSIFLQDKDRNTIATSPKFEREILHDKNALRGRQFDHVCPTCFPNGIEI